MFFSFFVGTMETMAVTANLQTYHTLVIGVALVVPRDRNKLLMRELTFLTLGADHYRLFITVLD
jgi:hypothetical protein